MALSAILLTLASFAAAPVKSVPDDMQGVWGKHGRCDISTDRLTISDHNARWGSEPFRPITFDDEQQSIYWDEEGVVDNFVRGQTRNVLVHNAQGFGMPGEEGYARCINGVRRVAWPAKGPSPKEVKAGTLQLYREVRRLNAQCVSVGGGVSGAPQCDDGTARESMLEQLGYCIDYPHGEKLVRCNTIKRKTRN